MYKVLEVSNSTCGYLTVHGKTTGVYVHVNHYVKSELHTLNKIVVNVYCCTSHLS